MESIEVISSLGKGGFGRVDLIKKKNCVKLYALKTVFCEKWQSKNGQKSLQSEVKWLKMCKGVEFISQVEFVYESAFAIHIGLGKRLLNL